MLRTTLVLTATMLLAGCESFYNSDSARQANYSPTMPQLAAYAASHQYPTIQPTDHWRTAAIVNRANGTIKIYNFDARPMRDADVWVNKAYLQHVSGIAPNSSVIIRTRELYNGLGQSFSSQNSAVSLVQMQLGNEFCNLQGPAAE